MLSVSALIDINALTDSISIHCIQVVLVFRLPPQVTGDMIRELFNAMCANFVPNPVTEPPVTNIRMDASGTLMHIAAHALPHDNVIFEDLINQNLCTRLG